MVDFHCSSCFPLDSRHWCCSVATRRLAVKKCRASQCCPVSRLNSQFLWVSWFTGFCRIKQFWCQEIHLPQSSEIQTSFIRTKWICLYPISFNGATQLIYLSLQNKTYVQGTKSQSLCETIDPMEEDLFQVCFVLYLCYNLKTWLPFKNISAYH